MDVGVHVGVRVGVRARARAGVDMRLCVGLGVGVGVTVDAGMRVREKPSPYAKSPDQVSLCHDLMHHPNAYHASSMVGVGRHQPNSRGAVRARSVPADQEPGEVCDGSSAPQNGFERQHVVEIAA